MFTGHTSGIKQVLFNTDERRLISCADDKTLRFWDITSGQEIKKFDLSAPVGGIELSKDQDILTVAHGQTVSFFNAESFEKIKEISIPTTVFTASLLYGRRIFVCGGDDFKLYKYNYDSGTEIGMTLENIPVRNWISFLDHTGVNKCPWQWKLFPPARKLFFI